MVWLSDAEVAQFRATHRNRANQLVHLIAILLVHIDAQHLAVRLFGSDLVPVIVQSALVLFFFSRITEKTAGWYMLLAITATWLRSTPLILGLEKVHPWW